MVFIGKGQLWAFRVAVAGEPSPCLKVNLTGKNVEPVSALFSPLIAFFVPEECTLAFF
jgi:hypothetical protein